MILLLVLVAFLGFIFWYYNDSLKPVSDTSRKVEVTIDNADGMQEITAKLAEAGAIKDARMAYYYARLEKINTIRAGTFIVDQSWDVQEIFDYMSQDVNASITDATVTIVEGDWCKDIAKKINAALPSVSADELMSLWNNREWIESQMGTFPFLTEDMFQDGVRVYLEGYLFPETYRFSEDATAEDVTIRMLEQTENIYEKYSSAIEASTYNTHEIFTIASIVQYEAGGESDEDLKTIAGIIYNRLAIDMPLQCSVTVCYAIDFDKDVDDWTACEVNSDFESPYNTYLYTGLPPGPIENPGESALNATLNPIQTDYYYWMADINGGTGIHYATTLDEHNANIAQYGS